MRCLRRVGWIFLEIFLIIFQIVFILVNELRWFTLFCVIFFWASLMVSSDFTVNSLKELKFVVVGS